MCVGNTCVVVRVPEIYCPNVRHDAPRRMFLCGTTKVSFVDHSRNVQPEGWMPRMPDSRAAATTDNYFFFPLAAFCGPAISFADTFSALPASDDIQSKSEVSKSPEAGPDDEDAGDFSLDSVGEVAAAEVSP